MTFLELAKRVRQECGIAGDGPSTVYGQTREMKRLVDWVSQSWVEIQNERPDWQFMRSSVIFNTQAGKQYYSITECGLSDFSRWINDSFRQYLQSAGIATEIILAQEYNYSAFRDFYMLGSRRLVTGRPLCVTIGPDKGLLFGFTPNDVYVTSAEYYITNQVLTFDADIPNLPENYHMLIVYRAMQKYGMFEVANEQIQAGKEQYAQMFNRLVMDQTPMVMMGGSLI